MGIATKCWNLHVGRNVTGEAKKAKAFLDDLESAADTPEEKRAAILDGAQSFIAALNAEISSLQASMPEPAAPAQTPAAPSSMAQPEPVAAAPIAAPQPAAVAPTVEWAVNKKAKSETLAYINGELMGGVFHTRSPGTSDWGWKGMESRELHFTQEKAMSVEREAVLKRYERALRNRALDAATPTDTPTSTPPATPKQLEMKARAAANQGEVNAQDQAVQSQSAVQDLPQAAPEAGALPGELTQPPSTGESPVAQSGGTTEERAYTKGQAEVLARRMTNQGLPSEAYPHPTEAGMWAIRVPGEQEAAPVEVAPPKPEAPAITKIKDAYGRTHHVRQSDLDNESRTQLPLYSAAGKRINGTIHRENIDLTGEKLAQRNAEDADNSLLDVITADNDRTFKTEAAAKRRLGEGYAATHVVAPASQVQPDATGFVLVRKPGEEQPADAGADFLATSAPTAEADATGEEIPPKSPEVVTSPPTVEAEAVPNSPKAESDLPPRVAETPDQMFDYLRKTAGGVVAEGKILYPAIKVIGMGGTFQWYGDKVSKLGTVGDTGTIQPASESESADVMDALEKDQAQIVLLSHWGGSGRGTGQKVVKVLHSPRGMEYKSRDEWLAKKPAPAQPEPQAQPNPIADAADAMIKAAEAMKAAVAQQAAPEAGKPAETEDRVKTLLRNSPIAANGDVYAVAGDRNAGIRQEIMSAILGKKATKQESGITALREALWAMAEVPDGTIASKDDALRAWISGKPAATKEPWQMTQAEVGNSLNAKGWKSSRGVQVVAPSPKSGLYETTHDSKTDVYLPLDEAERYMRDYNATAHRRHVEYALAQGKPVPAEVLADYPDIATKEPAQGAEKVGADGDLRGYAYALVKKGQILTSGSFPTSQYMEPESRATVDHWKAEAERLGADLFIGGYPNQSNWKPQEGLFFGMTWDELSAKQQKGFTPPASLKGKMPEQAVLVHSAQEKPTEKVGAGETATAEEASKPVGFIATHKDLFERLRDGNATLDEYKAGFASILDNKDAVMAELGAMTKDKLLEFAGGRYKNDKKDEVIRGAWWGLTGDFQIGRGLTYSMGENAHDSALRALVERTTQEDIDAFAGRVKAQRDEYSSRLKQMVGAVKDPKTVEDFDAALRLKKSEGMTFAEARMSLTPEQRAEYDRLKGMQSRDERKARADQQRTDVRAPGEAVGASEIIKTKHTKLGHDLWQFTLERRVPPDEFKSLVQQAKRMGGDYSSYRGNGAIPGWQFRTEEAAIAFRALVAGDTTAAKEVMQERRDAFADDRSQSAVERLNEMAERMEERADESLGRERKENTDRRARMAANAEAAANSEKAMATTMRRIAAAISDGTAQFLDRVRQKAQIEYLTSALRSAQYKELQAKYDSYGEQEKHRGDPVTAETADYAEFPQYTMMRSDLANLARQMIVLPNMKMLGQRVLKAADDTSDAYTKFAKEHLLEVSRFGSVERGGFANFSTLKDAERSIEFSKLGAIAVPLQIKRGEYRIILSPSEAINKGIWKGDDRLMTLDQDTGAEIVEKLGRLNRKTGRRGMDSPPAAPWQFENAYNDRKRLAGMGIEQPWEFRAALREFANLKEAPKERDKIKQMERAMIGRKNDGLDFFPTPAGVADELVQAAGIEEGMAVLEPSAGMGHIAERIRAAGVDPDVVEMAVDRRELLEAKGFRLVGSDFMDMSPRGFTYGDVFRAPDGTLGVMRGSGGLGSNRVGLDPLDANGQPEPRRMGWYDRDELKGVEKRAGNSGYDRIIMNPPFSDRRDAEHVQHAYTLLKPGGRLVSLMGEGVFFGQDKKAQAFRDWLEQVGGTSEKLEEGTFLDPSLPVNTGVNARMVVVEKPEGDAETTFNSLEDDQRSAVTRAIDRAIAQESEQPTETQRGAGWLKIKLRQAQNKGELSAKAVEMVEWLVKQNPALVKYLAVAVENPKELMEGDDKSVALESRAAMDTYAKHSIDPENVPIGDWAGRTIFHGTSDAGADSIHSDGVIIDKSTGGYFGVGFYAATDAKLAANNYADFAEENDLEGKGSVIAVRIKDTARILDLRDEKDWEAYQKADPGGRGLSLRDFAEKMTRQGIDGLFDRSFGGVVIYNPKAIEVLPDAPISANALESRANQPTTGAAGNYNPFTQVMTLFRGNASDTTAIHEILHHLERMMPAEMQAEIRKEWLRAVTSELQKAQKAKDQKRIAYFEAVLVGDQKKATELLTGKGMEGFNAPALTSTVKIGRAFSSLVTTLGKDDVSELLMNWNDSELSDDGTKIILFPGRDRRYSAGELGGSLKVGKGEFLSWLHSDAPLDPSVFEVSDEWRTKVEAARNATGLNPAQPEFNAVEPAPTFKAVDTGLDDATPDEQFDAVARLAESRGWNILSRDSSNVSNARYMRIEKPTEYDPEYGVTEYEVALLRFSGHANRRVTADVLDAELDLNVAPGADIFSDAMQQLDAFMETAINVPGRNPNDLAIGQDYQYLNPSEFWAVRMTSTAAARFDAKSIWARSLQWLREALEHIKGALGMKSDHPLLKALDDLIARGNGEFVSKEMLGSSEVYAAPRPLPAGSAGKDGVIADSAFEAPGQFTSPRLGTKFANAREAVEWLAQNMDGEGYRQIARKILPFLRDVPVHYVRVGDTVPAKVADLLSSGSAAVAYQADGVADGHDAIYVLEGRGDTEEGLLHEALHIATSRRLLDATAAAEFSDIAKAIRSSLYDAGAKSTDQKFKQAVEFFRREFRSPGELVAYGFSSPAFQDLLKLMAADGKFYTDYRTPADLAKVNKNVSFQSQKRIPAPAYSMWHRLVDAVRALFGGPKAYQEAYERAIAANAAIDRNNELASRVEFKTLEEKLNSLLDALLQRPELSLSKGGAAQPIRDYGVSIKESGPEEVAGVVMRDVSLAARLLLHPRQVAANHKPFVPVFDTAIKQFEERDRIVSGLGEMAKPYFELTHAQRLNVNKIVEQGRLDRTVYTVADLENGIHHAESGDLVTLDAEEIGAYKALRKTFNEALSLFRDTMLEEFGFAELIPEQKAAMKLRQMIADGEIEESRIEWARHVAKAIDEIEQAKRTGYAPFNRYGQFVVAVKALPAGVEVQDDDGKQLVTGIPEDGDDPLTQIVTDLGGQYDVFRDGWVIDDTRKAVLRALETTLFATKVEVNAFNEWRKQGKDVTAIPEVKAAFDEAKRKYGNAPNARVLAFHITEKAKADDANLSTFDELARISDVDVETWDAVREKLQEAIKAKSFRKHFFGSDNTPGYSVDFERSVADYIIGMSGYLARRKHVKDFDNAIKHIKAPALAKYAEDYRKYINSPADEFALLKNIGFLYYIAGSTATAVANLTQVPMLTMPTLVQFVPHHIAAREVARAWGETLEMFSPTTTGLQMFDPAKVPADVRDVFKAAWEDQLFVPLETLDLMAASSIKTVGGRKTMRALNVTTQAIAYMFMFAERLNRITTFIAAARISRMKVAKDRMRDVVKNDAWARHSIGGRAWGERNFAEWAVDESQYRMGKVNRPTVMRGVGSPLLQFKGYMIQTLEAGYRMAVMHGKGGRPAALAALAMMWLLGGIWGTPGLEDLREMIERLYKVNTGKDLDLKTEMRQLIARQTGSAAIAAAANKGIPYATVGVDMSRVGMGNILPDSALQVGGIPVDLAIARPMRAAEKMAAGKTTEAMSEFLPNFIKNPAMGLQWKRDGLRDKYGSRMMTPGEFDYGDVAIKSLGWTPTKVTNRREYTYAESRAERGIDELKRRYTNDLVRAYVHEAEAKDPAEKAEYRADQAKILARIEEHNKTASPENLIKLDPGTLRRKAAAEFSGSAAREGKERKLSRGEAVKRRELFQLR